MERKLSVYQFYEILQLEWLVADLRCRIFQSDKDKAYWRKVREGKQIKIENIAEKNRLPTIFNDDELKRDLEKRIYNDYTYPDFHYKDPDHQQSQGHSDLLNYYSKGTEVRFESQGDMKVGRVVDYTPFATTLRVQCLKTHNIETALVSKAIRIL